MCIESSSLDVAVRQVLAEARLLGHSYPTLFRKVFLHQTCLWLRHVPLATTGAVDNRPLTIVYAALNPESSCDKHAPSCTGQVSGPEFIVMPSPTKDTNIVAAPAETGPDQCYHLNLS